eukprot:c18142_g1_i1.p1 GENE.c18142_g1_i1~~c18142_g1_i1.p1  ORF type:complete len:256 (+),score=53.43 c18142_g1_i1:72-839(+)
MNTTELWRENPEPSDIFAALEHGHEDVSVDSLDDNPRRLAEHDKAFITKLMVEQHMFIIVDICLPDHPLVFASSSFLSFTQYDTSEIHGRNCRFLQSPNMRPEAPADSSPEEVLAFAERKASVLLAEAENRETLERLRAALVLQIQSPHLFVLRNFKKDGTPFVNQLILTGITLTSDPAPSHYIGVLRPATCPEDAADSSTNPVFEFRRSQLLNSAEAMFTDAKGGKTFGSFAPAVTTDQPGAPQRRRSSWFAKR